MKQQKIRTIHVGYLRSGFEYFLEGFAPPHFPAEITTFQVELDELYRFHYSVFRPNIPNSQKSAKTVKKHFKNTSNFVKPIAIRLEILSNSLIHFSSRTRRVLSNGHLLSLTSCSWWLQNAKSNCKIPGFQENLSRFAHKCFPTLSFTHPVEVDEFQWISE